MPAIKPIHYKKLVKVFEKTGWRYDRTKGDHLVFIKEGSTRPIIIPAYKTVPVFIIKNNLRTANITNEEYLKILKNL
jgi:predicted RNA binding protein YcfA (HicA-like mRNA interferase family)